MEYNAGKCKIVHAGSANPKFDYHMNGYAPAGTVLESSRKEKDLGVVVHDSLKPSEQCSAAAKKANAVLGQMALAFTYRHKSTWLHLYRLRVRPLLETSVQAWAPYAEGDIDVLEKVQERAVRMTSGLQGRTYLEKLRDAKMLTLAERRTRGDMMYAW